MSATRPRRGAGRLAPDPTPREVVCDYCGDRHPAVYSHEGAWNQGAVYAVVCGQFTDYYTHSALVAPGGNR